MNENIDAWLEQQLKSPPRETIKPVEVATPRLLPATENRSSAQPRSLTAPALILGIALVAAAYIYKGGLSPDDGDNPKPPKPDMAQVTEIFEGAFTDFNGGIATDRIEAADAVLSGEIKTIGDLNKRLQKAYSARSESLRQVTGEQANKYLNLEVGKDAKGNPLYKDEIKGDGYDYRQQVGAFLKASSEGIQGAIE